MTEDKDRLHVLQITDCHLLPDPDSTLLGVRTQSSLAAVLETACAERTPDAVLATGDLADVPAPSTYELFLSTLRHYHTGPLLCVPGNHDDGAAFKAALPTEDLALGDWRLAGLDTHVDGQVGGNVGLDELRRLRSALDDCGRANVLVAGHHCPVEIDCPWLDKDRIDNGAELLDLLVVAGVKAYVFGHIHQEVMAERALPLYGSPSTCFQFAGDTSSFAIDDAKPGYRWLDLAPDGSVRTRVGRVAGFDLNLDLTDRDRP